MTYNIVIDNEFLAVSSLIVILFITVVGMLFTTWKGP